VAVLLGSGPQTQSVGMAANDVAPVVDQIVSTGQVLVASLDATAGEVSPEDAVLRGVVPGSLIEDVRAGGAAATAGLRSGDVITQLDDVKVDPGHPLLQLLRTRFKPGQRVTVSYTRGATSSQVQLTLHGEHPACS
jgi:putative serine protease PepD